MKKTKRYEDGGYLLDSEGKRVKSGSGEDIQTGSYDKEADMESARNKLAQDVQKKLKDDSDSARVSKDAEEGARAPTSSVKASDGMDESDRRREAAESAPKRQDSVKTKPSVTKPRPYKQDSEQQKERFLKEIGVSKPAVSSSYRSEGANKAKPSTSSGSAASTAPAKKSGSSFSALPMNPSLLRQRDEAEKKRDAARAARRSADEAEEKARPAKEAAQRKMLSEQPGAVAYRKKREEQDKMSPGQRSAARGKALKEFFGMKKGGSINGIAKRGLTRCKTV